MDNLTIRKATFLDVERIVELRLLSQGHFEKSNPLIWRMTEEGKKLLKQKVENDVANGNVQILLAEADGEIIGYLQGEVTSRSDYLPRTVGHVSLAYVVKQFRRRGVGRLLVKELCKFFNSNKAENLTVRYVIGNTEAERFWKKLGFESIITTSSTYPKELGAKLGHENE
jgi:ribosomal protein S18 acetylase RimI-like enzyme